MFASPCQSCSESCAFQAVAAVVDFVYQIKAIQKKAKKRKVLVGSPSESSWSVEKSGRQHRKNGLGVDALTGSPCRRIRTPPLDRQRYQAQQMAPYRLRRQAQAFREKRWNHDVTVVLSGINPGRAAFYLHLASFRAKRTIQLF